MTDSNEPVNKIDRIYKCAEGLFSISKEIRDINIEISDMLLYFSDRLLNIIETSESLDEPQISSPPEPQVKENEICPDCGGIKSSCQTQKPSQPKVEETNPGSMCHGHTGDGAGEFKKQVEDQPKKSHSQNVQNEVRSLIDEIRKGL